jgi:polyisoprenoid-binding protein YceI
VPERIFRGDQEPWGRISLLTRTGTDTTLQKRGIEIPIHSFKAMPPPMLKKDAIGANAWTVGNRSEFNAGKYAPNVGDEVRIDIAIEAIKE